MQFDTPQDIRRLANIIDAEIIGEADKSIQGLNELSKVRIGDITYIDKNEEDIEPYLRKPLITSSRNKSIITRWRLPSIVP